MRQRHHRSARVWHALSRDHTVVTATHAFIRERNEPHFHSWSRFWFSFADPGGIEDWVDLGATTCVKCSGTRRWHLKCNIRLVQRWPLLNACGIREGSEWLVGSPCLQRRHSTLSTSTARGQHTTGIIAPGDVLLGCVECMRCRLLLLMFAVSVCHAAQLGFTVQKRLKG